MSNETAVANDPATIISQGLSDLAALKTEVAEADARVEEAKTEAEAAIAAVTEEQSAVVAAVVEDANAVRDRYAARIDALVATKWATPAALAEWGHSVPRSRRKK